MNTLTLGAFEIALSRPIAWLLATVAAVAIVRLLYRQHRTEPGSRLRRWRLALLALAQPACAALLYFALFPPVTKLASTGLVVLTSGATRAQLDQASASGAVVVALPEAASFAQAERAPDLATALRRHPQATSLHVVGAGLEPRDREVASNRELRYSPAPLPRGLVELTHATHVAAGDGLSVAGRAKGLGGGSVELLDPGARRVDRAALDDDGRFTLSATTRVPGVAAFTLRLLDAEQQIVEEVELPLQVVSPEPLRVLVLAGAPNPELKYLRRWARDAGLALHTQIAAGGGLQLGDAPLPLAAAELARFDVVVLDERSWSSLTDAQRTALDEAVRSGLGVLLRVTAALSETERRRLAKFGFEVDAGRDTAQVRLALRKRDDQAEHARLGPGAPGELGAVDAAIPEPPALSRRALRMQGADALPLLTDETDAAVAVWRASGRGRIALWTLTDSYRLVLAGRSDLHGELWSRALGTLARAQPQKHSIHVSRQARQGERVSLCGLEDDGRVIAPDGAETELLRDPATGDRACAAYWPSEAGWHHVQAGEREELFYVRAREDAPGLRAAELREATLQLAAASPHRGATAPAFASGRPGPRWPWWLAWLVVSTALWWFERARAGRR